MELEAKQAELITASKTIKEKEEKIVALNKDIEKLQTRLALLKVDYRLARLTVVDQEKRGEKGDLGPRSNLWNSTTKERPMTRHNPSKSREI